MAQQHPTINGKLEGMSNVSYDLIAALSGTGDVIDTMDTYIEDAKRANDREVVQAFDQIRADLLRHCDVLRNLISNQCKQGTF